MLYFARTTVNMNVINTDTLIKLPENESVPYKFDTQKKEWIKDYEMCAIYTDHIEVEEIDEKTALEILERMKS